MPDLVAELSQRARELEPEDRARLAEELLASLEVALEPEVDAAWDEELRKRIAEIENGTVELIPADEVFARVRRALLPRPRVGTRHFGHCCVPAKTGVLARAEK